MIVLKFFCVQMVGGLKDLGSDQGLTGFWSLEPLNERISFASTVAEPFLARDERRLDLRGTPAPFSKLLYLPAKDVG
jgi:hypothetical protein